MLMDGIFAKLNRGLEPTVSAYSEFVFELHIARMGFKNELVVGDDCRLVTKVMILYGFMGDVIRFSSFPLGPLLVARDRAKYSAWFHEAKYVGGELRINDQKCLEDARDKSYRTVYLDSVVADA